MQPAAEQRHHLEPSFAIVMAQIFDGQRGLLIQLRNPLERQPTFGDILRILGRIECNTHFEFMLQRKCMAPIPRRHVPARIAATTTRCQRGIAQRMADEDAGHHG